MRPSGMNCSDCLAKLRYERDEYIRKLNCTCDDLWALMPSELHSELLKIPERTSEGPDRITRSCVLGMHVIHDSVKNVYVIPKHKPPMLGYE